eukprot:TRINITY_DN2499_c0_g2_i1.p1 TRINITY_DN2499_c0_g2~~TRINITY_DN2499_c0_g2_i1.p1  ORF type:complete len:291 (-),score=69.94 TRINITY_DN2499_c0_g2_i1:96-968(-)
MGEPTREELVTICTDFMLAAPPGEFMEVVTDIRGLLSDESIINDAVPSTFREYNTEQMLQVKSPTGDSQLLITKYGEVSDTEYLDPLNKIVVTFDHVTQEVTGSRPIAGELDADVEPYRVALEAQAVKYAADFYLYGSAAVYSQKEDDGQYTLIVCISSSKFEPHNFWTGRWRAIWTATFAAGAKSVDLNGLIKVNVHYYEDGNVQLSTECNKSMSVAGAGDAAATAKAIIDSINKSEAAYQTAVVTNYKTMGETSFKALRRPLPITKTRIDWTKILYMKMGSAGPTAAP